MTKKQVPQAVIDTLSNAGVELLILGIKIANDHGSFEGVVALCEDMVKQSKKTDRPLGAWAGTEYRGGLDFLDAKWPGCTTNLAKYYTEEELEQDADAKAAEAEMAAYHTAHNIKVTDTDAEGLAAAAMGKK